MSPAYLSVPAPIATQASRFAEAALSYDSSNDSPTAFLDAVAPIATADELGHLAADSSRAHLDWSALRARSETASVAITGVSMTAAQPPTVLVEIERTTTTSFGSVQDFIQVSVGLQLVDGTWRVSRASGGGL